MSERTITITLTYDDLRWHDRDAEQAVIDTAAGLREIARYHPGSKVVAVAERERLPVSRPEQGK